MKELEKITEAIDKTRAKRLSKKPNTGPQNTKEWLEKGAKEGRGSGFGGKTYGV
jgi:hypothetical protein